MPDKHDSTISADADLVTLITVFTCADVHQEALVEALNLATTEVFVRVPGFISANIHASADRSRVVYYAQWADTRSYEAMLHLPEAQKHMDEIMCLVESADPRLFTVRAVHHV